jgi:biotin synthase-related radical SAM superfamily protein
MGEDFDLTIAGCRRAIDMGVYPFVVPLRPVAGSLMQDAEPPSAEYTDRVYRRVQAYMAYRGMDAGQVAAGCARCQACSAMQTLQPLIASSASAVG